RVVSAPSQGFKGYQLIVVPKNTLKASGVLSRGTPSFDICFGAIWTSTTISPTAWQAKPLTGTRLISANPVPDGFGTTRYWGLPTNCGTAGVALGDPCIPLPTKQPSDVVALLPILTS